MELVADKNFGMQTWPIDNQYEQIGKEKVGMLSDWLGEIGNRILAQILAVLAKYSMNVKMGTPKVIAMPQFGAPCPLDETRLQIPFQTEYGCLHVFLQLKISPDLKTPKKNTEETSSPGDIVEF